MRVPSGSPLPSLYGAFGAYFRHLSLVPWYQTRGSSVFPELTHSSEASLSKRETVTCSDLQHEEGHMEGTPAELCQGGYGRDSLQPS